MTNLWPWLVLAGLGATHGLSPANGWMFAAACGLQSGDSRQAHRALLPIAIGHVTSIVVVAGAVALGMRFEGNLLQCVAGTLLLAVASCRLLRHGGPRPAIGTEAGHAGIACWSFLMASTQGTGLMLVPVLVPLCMAASPARELTASGSLPVAAAAIAVHTAAMLAATGLIATGVCRGFFKCPQVLSGALLGRAWTTALMATGVLLVAMR